jgi:hypothetical protein
VRALPAVVLSLAFLSACSTPPQKEIDLAQGALDAARAAGADQYAPKEMTAATATLQQAHDAISQRDFRLALTRALDAHDRALEAAKAAAEGQVRTHAETGAAVTAARGAVETLARRLELPDVAKLPKRDVDAARAALKVAQADVQKASAAADAADYIGARKAVEGLPGRMAAQMQALETAGAKKPARPPRRRP